MKYIVPIYDDVEKTEKVVIEIPECCKSEYIGRVASMLARMLAIECERDIAIERDKTIKRIWK